MPYSFSSSQRCHSRNGSTTSNPMGPTVMSTRFSPSLRWARTVVWRPRQLTMAKASAVPRLGYMPMPATTRRSPTWSCAVNQMRS